MNNRLITLLLLSFFLISCDPFKTSLKEKDVQYFEASELSDYEINDTLTLMTWNIKFGGGRIDFFFDCWGDRVIMSEEEVTFHLDGLAAKINQVNPDILLLQEVDLDSKRSAFIDQVQYLLDKTELNFGVFASQWKASYVPSDGIGKINSGNVILSRYPIENASRIGLPLLESQSFVVRYFYLKRNILEADVIIGDRNLRVFNTHLSAFDKDGTKKKQIDQLMDTLIARNRENITFILGGDLNLLPPNSIKVKEFPDSVCEGEFDADDYTPTIGWIEPLYLFSPDYNLTAYEYDNSPYFTHTTNHPDRGAFWNRKLDYLFTNGEFVSGSNITHQDEQTGMNTMILSDHCPVSIKLVMR